jgi:hypothetical protein
LRIVNAAWKAALLLGALVLTLLLARTIAWRTLRLLLRTVDRLPEVAQSRAWARLTPLRTWLRMRHPRAFAIVNACLNPAQFRGLPLTLLIIAGTYVAALFGGLADEVIEAGSVMRFDQAVNDAFDR